MKINGHKIEKRKDGRYQVRIYIDKKQTSIYGKTQEEIKQKVKEIINSTKIKKLPYTIKFHDYCDQWYKVYKIPNLSSKTLKTTIGILENHIKKQIPNININSITPIIINEGLNKINGRPKEYASQYLREMFKRAYKDKIIKNDIYESITKYTHKRKEGTALNKEQRDKLIKACNTIEDGEVILFYLYTGCRKSEALLINKTDIQEDFIFIPGTKTEKATRIVPIFNQLKPILEKLKKNNKKKLINISDTTIKRRVQELNQKLNFHFTIKDMRTTYGTMLAEAGINDSVIAKWMGQTNTNTTKKYYIKVLSDFEKDNVKKLDTCFDT